MYVNFLDMFCGDRQISCDSLIFVTVINIYYHMDM